MKKQLPVIIAISITLLFWNCTPKKTQESIGEKSVTDSSAYSNVPSDEFRNFWYSGKAEVSSYQLTQARYGELRAGEAELIFVTEDFSISKQVKLDDPSNAGNDAINVLKMNMVKKFNTGIYPYSMMLSVFSPVSGGHALKTTSTVQEWCGQTFTQINLHDNQYNIQLHSYFESEGEVDTTLPSIWQEDEFWTIIRINPSLLPTGEIKVIPGALSQRLRHSRIDRTDANAAIRDADSTDVSRFNNASLKVYTLNYPSEQRSLSIFFRSEFPYTIEGWEETYPDGFGENKKMLTTRAIRKETMMTDYWKHNAESDTLLRDSLGLMRYQ